MSAQVKINQDTPQINIKDKSVDVPKKEELREIKIKQNESIEIDTEKIAESVRPKIKQKIKDADELIIKAKEDKDKDRGYKVTDENLQKIKDATNEVLSQINIQLDFSIDKKLNKMVVKVINKETGEVIRQIPPEEMLEIAKRMEEMVGVLLDKWS